jgi:perosamine synthetase
MTMAAPTSVAPRVPFLPFHVPSIGDEEIAAVVETLRSGWLTTGAKTRQFESEFARYLGVAHAVALNSGTAALHLALEAVGVGEGDEVVVPTMTFAATAEVVAYLKATPVLVDSEPDTLNMDVAAFARAITPRTRAVIPVHFGGQPCEMEPIVEIARRHSIAVVEDAAHSLPASYRGRTVGTIGDVTCFSFYATKTLTTGEGGMATTRRAELADRMRMMSLHGISRDAWKRYTAEGSWRYEILDAGYKYNLTDVAAALGLVQLAKCDRMREARRRIASQYDAAFAGVPGLRVPVCRPDREHAWHLYVVRIDRSSARVSRDRFIERLKQAGIGTSVHFIPLHLHPYYRNRDGCRPEDLPVATSAFEEIVSLPIYPRMSDTDLADVVAAVKHALVA